MQKPLFNCNVLINKKPLLIAISLIVIIQILKLIVPVFYMQFIFSYIMPIILYALFVGLGLKDSYFIISIAIASVLLTILLKEHNNFYTIALNIVLVLLGGLTCRLNFIINNVLNLKVSNG